MGTIHILRSRWGSCLYLAAFWLWTILFHLGEITDLSRFWGCDVPAQVWEAVAICSGLHNVPRIPDFPGWRLLFSRLQLSRMVMRLQPVAQMWISIFKTWLHSIQSIHCTDVWHGKEDGQVKEKRPNKQMYAMAISQFLGPFGTKACPFRPREIYWRNPTQCQSELLCLVE